MKHKFDTLSARCSKLTTTSYSTSFSLGIKFLNSEFHHHIYSIYGFVRFADEIVDSFHNFNKADLLEKFTRDTYEAIEQGISLNPILNCFQNVVNAYKIDRSLIDTFLESMRMDLGKVNYNDTSYEKYILGSAEVVGLMCLRVFVKGNATMYETLKPYAMKLGSAFQKVNFLRDAREDFQSLGRNYFPNANLMYFTLQEKLSIEADIRKDFEIALEGIRKLPAGSRRGVYLAYFYYKKLFDKICRTDVEKIMSKRIRIPNLAKFYLMINSYMRHQLNLI